MNKPASSKGTGRGDDAGSRPQYYSRDFWIKENLSYAGPHFRLEKSARIVNRIARGKECALLDVGCGPATLAQLLRDNIRYYGIDIAIQNPAPNLIQANLLESPVKFGDKNFEIVLAQGFFEYIGDFQEQKLAEIARLLKADGTFIVSYVNFGHRNVHIYWPYSNVQPVGDFRMSLGRCFKIERSFPVSHNWNHSEPARRPVKAVNMYLNANIPFISPLLAVEYFFICSAR